MVAHRHTAHELEYVPLCSLRVSIGVPGTRHTPGTPAHRPRDTIALYPYIQTDDARPRPAVPHPKEIY